MHTSTTCVPKLTTKIKTCENFLRKNFCTRKFPDLRWFFTVHLTKLEIHRTHYTLCTLDNHTCYNKIVCTILFSLRLWVCWCKLFSVLSTLQKYQNFDETPSLYNYNKKTCTDFGYFSLCEMLIPLDCAADSEWNGIINFIVSSSVVELFIYCIKRRQRSIAQSMAY